MKYSDLVQVQPLALKRRDAAQMVGGEVILAELLQKNLVRPKIKRHKLTVFDVNELREGWEKLGQCPDHSEGV